MRKKVLFLIPLFFLIIAPVVIQSSFIHHMFILIFFYIALSVAWNILALSGNISLGHGAFFGLATYTSVLLLIKYDITPWVGVLAGVGVSLVGAFAMCLPLLRLRGPMFALATIAFVEVLRQVAVTWRSLTGGSEGLTTPFKPGWFYLVFPSKVPFYYIFLFLAVSSIYISHRIYHSPIGYHSRAIADDEEAAQLLGVNTKRVQMVALFWSAGITGVLGVFFSQYTYMIDPEWAFSLMLFSVQPALNGIIGGLGTVFGPVLGAIVMTPLGEYLRSYLGALQQGLNFFVYGLLLIVVVMIAPGGIFSGLTPILQRIQLTRATQAMADVHSHLETPTKKEKDE